MHYAPHGPIDVAAWDVDVLICSPYKFFGPHLGLAFGKRELLESWRPYKVRPAANEPVGHRFELGTLRTSSSRASSRPSSTSTRSAGTRSRPTRPLSASGFWTGFPTRVELYGLRTMSGRVPTFCFNLPGRSPEAWRRFSRNAISPSGTGTTTRSRRCEHLGLEDGAVRAGIVHYNTEDEVDRLLAALADLA